MKQLVFSYLSKYYEIDTSEVKNDGIYVKDNTDRPRPPKYYNRLLAELVLIFSLSEKVLIEFIDEWAKVEKPDVDLDFYWYDDFFGLPIAHQVAARTIGMDLVSVQPIAAPTALLMYNDFIYIGDTQEPETITVNRPREITRPRRLDRETLYEKWGDVIKEVMRDEDTFFKERLRGPYE